MRKILLAISDSLPTGDDPELVVDSALRQPIAEALADYTADTQKIMTRDDPVYSQHRGPSRHTWKDADGGHMSVTSKVLTRVMRALSDNSGSYSTLWTASMSRITGQMDRIPYGEGVGGVRSIAVDGARVMGTLQAIHFDAIRDAYDGDDSSIAAQEISDEANMPENMMAYLVGDWARERGIDVHRKDVEKVAMDAGDAQNAALQDTEHLLGVSRA